MFSRSQRLSRADVDAVLKQGVSKNTQHFRLRVFLRNRNTPPRVTVGVGKKIAKKAHLRNRMKRKVRAAVKDIYPTIKAGSDMLISVRSDISNLSHTELVQELQTLIV